MTTSYLPEGQIIHKEEQKSLLSTLEGLRHCMEHGIIVEGTALLCNPQHHLLVTLGPWTGTMPRLECARGIQEGTTKEIAILSRVGKPVACIITAIELRDGQPHPILSRRLAQEKALTNLLTTHKAGDVIPATITHLESFGAFVDIGCGLTSMVGIEHISVSRIPHTAQRFTVGQRIFVVILHMDRNNGRIYLTHRELLGTWEENVATFEVGMTVAGIVRGVKEYGLFVELTPNLSGLAELHPTLKEGDRASVYIKAIIPSAMKIKLLTIDQLPPLPKPPPLRYYISQGSIQKWDYAPNECLKIGAQTLFV